MNLPIHTRPVYKWLVWRFHQAIIPFPWISYISEWQIDKNLAPQGWWGDPLSLSDRHFSWQEGVKWAELARLWGVRNQLFEGQASDRQAAVGGRDEVERVQCSASLCITFTITHSSIPFPLDIKAIRNTSSKRSKDWVSTARQWCSSVAVQCENLVLHHNRKPAGVPAGTTACQASSSRLV